MQAEGLTTDQWEREAASEAPPRWILPVSVLLAIGLLALVPLGGGPVAAPRSEVVFLHHAALPPPPRVYEEPARDTAPAAHPVPRLQAPRATVPVAVPSGALTSPFGVHLNLELAPGSGGLAFPIAAEAASVGTALGAGEIIFDVVQADSMPRALVRLTPLYPPRARLRRVEGEVLVEFVVGTDGMVRDAAIAYAQPPGEFEQAALQSVQRWRFEPGTKDGRAVPVRVRQKLMFKLED